MLHLTGAKDGFGLDLVRAVISWRGLSSGLMPDHLKSQIESFYDFLVRLQEQLDCSFCELERNDFSAQERVIETLALLSRPSGPSDVASAERKLALILIEVADKNATHWLELKEKIRAQLSEDSEALGAKPNLGSPEIRLPRRHFDGELAAAS